MCGEEELSWSVAAESLFWGRKKEGDLPSEREFADALFYRSTWTFAPLRWASNLFRARGAGSAGKNPVPLPLDGPNKREPVEAVTQNEKREPIGVA